MAPKLYFMEMSPPATSVLLTAAAINLELELVYVNVLTKEHLSPEYLKLNPQHTIPTLVDDGKVIWDSHAINIYLVEKYAKNKNLYPEDPYLRAVINQRLHFNSGVLFSTLKGAAAPLIRKLITEVPTQQIASITEAYDFLEKFLNGSTWAAGNNLTLADFALLTSAIAGNMIVPIDAEKHPNIVAWIERAKKLPYFHIVENMIKRFVEILSK